jgi:hypothetical protein
MGALRQPQQREEVRADPRGSAHSEPYAGAPYPRWVVVSGVVIYCAVCWAIVVAAGSWGVELVRAAMAGPQ